MISFWFDTFMAQIKRWYTSEFWAYLYNRCKLKILQKIDRRVINSAIIEYKDKFTIESFFFKEIPLKKDARDETDVQCADADHTTNGIHQT